MVDEDGKFDLVERVERVALDAPVYDLDIERTHNFVAEGLVTHNSIYAFRGADIRNVLEFERDFPGARSIALEQNYRSTNTILEAANGVIRNNRERKEKNLWSELGEGDPVRVVEVEDEHAEARYVAAEIAMLVEQGYSGREIAVFYRTNAQSRVLEDVLVRQGDRVPGDRRPALLRARRGEGPRRVPAGDRQPVRRRLARCASRTGRAAGSATRRSRGCRRYADSAEISLWEAMEPLRTPPASAPARRRRSRAFRTIDPVAACRPRRSSSCRS